MWKELSDIFSLTGRVTRGKYFTLGLMFFLVKYLIDWLVATQGFGRPWSPMRYLIWPDGESLTVIQLPPVEQRFALVMLAMAIPFICIGVILTLQRLRDAGMSRLLIVLFFVPMVNLLFIVWLCLVPSLSLQAHVTLSREPQQAKPPEFGKNNTGAFWISCLVSGLLSACLVFLCANIFRSYGFGIFVLLPFVNGWLAAILYGLSKERTLSQCLAVGLTALGIWGLVTILFALEGIICLLMLAPMALALGALGAVVGYGFQRRWVERSTPYLILAVIVMTPTLMAAEWQSMLEPPLHMTQTEVIIDMPPEVVWKYVVTFLPLPEPTEWFFRMGVAYPKHAEMVGQGVGAIRYCVFSTGAFVEPITTWDEPRCLAFDVLEQPCTMQELSPYHIHPPHLDQFLVSRRGEFRLEVLPGGKTRLIGTTWYTNKMWPASYWGLWSNYLIGQIHRRVLEHVRRCAEEGR